MALGLVIAAALGLITAACVRPALRWLLEPEDEPDKIPYRELGSLSFVVGVGLVATLAAAVAAVTQPVGVLPAWWVLSSLGVLLAAIDFRTTWLPLRLTRAAWLAMAAALVGVGLAAGWFAAGRGLVGALAAGCLYLVVWRVSGGGFGFGDVRFAPLVGAATGSGSWTLLLWALVLGTFVGCAQALVALARRRRQAFPYAPAILAGSYLAAVLL